MALPTYTTGTVSVSNGGTVVTLVGGLWSSPNAKEGDYFARGDGAALIVEVTDATHIKITPWPGATVSGGAYTIHQNYNGRVVGVAAAEDVGDMLAALKQLGPIFNVPSFDTVPDPSYGADGQFAYQASTGLWWLKTSGAWAPSSSPSANRIRATGNLTVFWRSDGSDVGNTGLVDSSGGAFRTLQALWDYVCDRYDMGGHDVLFKCSGPHGTISGLQTSKAIFGSRGYAGVRILGSTTPSDYVISATDADCVGIGALLHGESKFTIGGFKLQTTTGVGHVGNCINGSGGSVAIVFGTSYAGSTGVPAGTYPIDFGPCAQTHVVSNHAADVFPGAINIISGSAACHGAALSAARLAYHNNGLTFVGAANSLSFPNGFWDCEDAAQIYIANMAPVTNAAAVNTAYPFGLVASNGVIRNYAATTTPWANGAVQQIGGGRYLETGLEPLPINEGGTGLTVGPPMFKAYLGTSMTGLGSGSTQKILFDTVVFDTGSYWNAATHKYQPLIAGTYRVSFNFVPSATTFVNQADAILGVISKNGTFGSGGTAVFLNVFPTFAAIAGDTAGASGSTLVQMNGSTDTLEIDVSVTASPTYSIGGGANMATQVTIERIGP